MTTNNNRSLIITTIALLCALAIFLTGLMGYGIFAKGLHFGNFNWYEKSKVICDESFDSTAVSKMIVAADMSKIEIKQSSDDKIRVVAKGFDENLLDISTQENAITVNSKSNTNAIIFTPFGGIKDAIKIDLYIPAIGLEALEIDSEFGSIEIDTLTDIDLSVSCNMGSIEAKNISGKFNLNSDMGSIEVKNISGCFDISTNMGSIEIDRIDINANSSVSTDMGTIEINQTNNIKIDYSASMGECDVKNNNPSSDITLTAKTNMGSVEIG